MPNPWSEFGAELRRWRESREVGLREFAASIPLDHSTLSKWENGHRPVPADQARRLDDALGATGHLVALHAAVSEVEALRRRLEDNASQPPDEDDMERRRLMRDAAAVTMGATIAPVMVVLSDAWQASEPPLPGASVSRAMIDDWENAADAHERRARVDPPAVVLAALAVDFTDMAPHLRHAQPDSVRRDLAHAAARHTALIAGKWIDLGNVREAVRWWSRTRTLSADSRDPLLASWLMTREALYRQGIPDENLAHVLAMAQQAHRLAGNRPSAPLVAAHLTEAQVLARMGRFPDAIDLLLRAEEIFDRLPTLDGYACDWNRHGLWFDQSLIYTLAGDSKRANDAQDAYFREFATESLAVTETRLHRAALQARTDPHAAIDQASSIITELPAEMRRTRYLTAARFTLDVLPDKARALPAARELRALTA